MEIKKAPAVYLLAGGIDSSARKEEALLKKIFADIAIKNPSVAYIGCASGDDRSFFAWIARKLKSCGAGEVRLARTTGKKFQKEETVKILESSDILFFSGGDVEEGMQVLAERRMKDLFKRLYFEGKIFIGVSAGSIMLCKNWVRWKDAEDDDTAEVFACLGIAEILCDTHAEEDGWVELKTLLNCLNEKGVTGYGIPSGGALKIETDRNPSVYGNPVIKISKAGNEFKETWILQEF